MTTKNYSARRFPILGPFGDSLPWRLVERFRVQAEKNHGQTLERLAERGGLAWGEILAALRGVSWFDLSEQDTTNAKALVEEIVYEDASNVNGGEPE